MGFFGFVKLRGLGVAFLGFRAFRVFLNVYRVLRVQGVCGLKD